MAVDTGEWMEPMPDGYFKVEHTVEHSMPVAYYSTHPNPHGLPDGASHQTHHTQNLPEDPQAFARTYMVQLPEASQPQLQTLMSPSVSSSGDAPSPWSAPDAETDLDCYSYHGSPLSRNVAVTYNHPVSPAASIPATYNNPVSPTTSVPAYNKPVSPTSWPVPFRPVDEQYQHHQPEMHSPVSMGSPHAMAQGAYAQTSHPFAGTPEAEDEEGGEGKGHESYATQIHRALRSFPDYSATVQQIYQWFRENTNRHKHTGWQNSIRHNLSMNGGFIKLPRPAAKGEGTSAAKRGNIWVLADTAEHGILSTAKYREPKSKACNTRARRPAGSSGRQSSGHRGGCATSRMKRRRRSQSGLNNPPPPPQQQQLPQGGFSHWQPQQEMRAPLTPENSGDEFGFAGGGMEFSVPQFPLSQYQMSDVVGTWDSGRLVADFRGLGMHETMQ